MEKTLVDFDNITFMSDEQIERERAAHDYAERTQQLEKLMPRAFRQTENERLEQPALENALAWAQNPHKAKLNLVLAGSTGVGKTRTAWEAIKERRTRSAGTLIQNCALVQICSTRGIPFQFWLACGSPLYIIL